VVDLEKAGGRVGHGAPATAEDLVATGDALLVLASTWKPDVALRSAFVWPVLEHTAWLWRDAPRDAPAAYGFAVALQVRADLLAFAEIALDASEIAHRRGIGPLARLQAALRNADPDADGGDEVPPPLPARAMLPDALRRWKPEDLPPDLFVKGRLYAGCVLARCDGHPRSYVRDRFVDVLDSIGPTATRALSKAAG
jgi:hypothetical protein